MQTKKCSSVDLKKYLDKFHIPCVLPGGAGIPNGHVTRYSERVTLLSRPGRSVLSVHALLVVPFVFELLTGFRCGGMFESNLEYGYFLQSKS